MGIALIEGVPHVKDTCVFWTIMQGQVEKSFVQNRICELFSKGGVSSRLDIIYLAIRAFEAFIYLIDSQ